MNFFTDRELGPKAATVNDIDVTVWNGVVAIVDSFISDNSFSKNFPEQCRDNLGVCGCNTTLFYDKLQALIPNLKIPLQRKEKFQSISSNWYDYDEKQEPTVIDTFACLDLIEFCFYHLSDAAPTGRLHEYFNHYHLSFEETGKSKEKFRREINTLFERNQIAYHLNEKGQIVRVIPDELKSIIKRSFQTKDTTLNDLLTQSALHFMLPKIGDRLRALEKAWDAFERAKTYYSSNKNASSTQLINLVSTNNTLFETYLTLEAKTLSEIGNKFHIRHFETDRQPITDTAHVDYFFYRMFALIDLFIKELEK